jgi:putative DNA primase/helicase
MISTGVPALSVAYTPDEAEMQKRLVAVLVESAPYLSIDNIDLPVESSILCSALTQPTIKGRILGETATVTASTATTVTLTGNNLQVSGDMSTRVVQVELDALVERPEDREFDRNLYEWVPANRASLVVDLLTVLRGFVVAGRPAQAFTRWGRFEEWSDLVRAALVWAGEADPVMTRDQVQAGDPVKAALGAVLAAWDAVIGKGYVTAGRLVECASQTSSLAPYDPLHPQLREALAEIAGDMRGGLSARRLGKWLARYDGRIQDGRRVERGEDRQGMATWRVGSVGSVGLCLSMGKNYLEEGKEFL